MDGKYVTALTCSHCGESTPHELVYAGRLIASITCTRCGFTIGRDVHDLRAAYLHDIQQRLVSKPGRMWHRTTRHPLRFVSRLPASLLVKPKRMYDELKPLLRR